MLEIINNRRSIRKFKDQPISKKDIKDLLEAAMNAPSAMNQQAWVFVVLENNTFKNYLDFNTNTPKGAPVGILICGDLSKQKIEGDYYIQDCSAATQNILLAAHAKGIGSVWTTVFPQNVKKIQELLRLPKNIIPFACLPVGYATKELTNAKSRYNEDVVHWNTW